MRKNTKTFIDAIAANDCKVTTEVQVSVGNDVPVVLPKTSPKAVKLLEVEYKQVGWFLIATLKFVPIVAIDDAQVAVNHQLWSLFTTH